MRGGITSVPLPAYWSSKDPEQWRRQSVKTSACTRSHCATNNANYAKITEPPAKKPRRPYNTYSRSRSLSATPCASIITESEKQGSTISDCNTQTPPESLVQIAPSSPTLTPPTPLQHRPTAPGSYDPGLTAPPPSECDDSSNDQPELESESPEEVSVNEETGEATMDPARDESSPWDQAIMTGALGVLVSSPTSAETRIASSPITSTGNNSCSELEDFPHTSISSLKIKNLFHPPPGSSESKDFPYTCLSSSESETFTTDEGTFSESEIAVLSLLDAGRSFQPTLDPAEFDGDDHHFPLKVGGSGSSATPALSEKGLDLRNDHDMDRISSFYNALYTPDTVNNANEQEEHLNVKRCSVEHDLTFKLAVEVALLSAVITIIMLACFPVLLSGVRYHILGCCSCTHESATGGDVTPPRSPLEQLKWLENWVYSGAQSLLGCRSPKQALGSTVFR
ncbi:hypothetical protein R1sor_003892 [Riccia sorocarpa]|uniref:Uncharacterized protein n=1 Tax=Riccia sorocarpa TaxID=122646 RepID=A0ABD3H6A6_9MARC